MRRTTLDTDKFESDPNHIVPHLKNIDGKNEPADFPYPNPKENHDFSFLSAAGGIVSSANEMTRYINAHIRLGAFAKGKLASKKSPQVMHSLQIQTPDGHYGRRGYGYGLSVTPDFLGHKMISHGGSILVSTAYMAIVPDRKIGVVMMGNSSGMPYSMIAESVLAILMGQEPTEAVPVLRIKERMKLLEGNYEVYRGLENLKIIIKSGMLYMESRDPLRDGHPSRTPLIPEDPTLASTNFYTLRSGLKYPALFRFKDDGSVDFFYGRYCYHKKD
jgi:CubicO group peptidase (beta-lactamase class C family)